jgi:hypothetical protein
MHPFVLSKIVNGAIWLTCGVVVLTIRGPFFFQSSYVLIWELIGGAMVAYGGGRVVWALARGAPTTSTIR